ncbi:hypothetical protein [Hoyosella altamirensis]|uniref:Uncharacterized protein n=1 Tax=Hoyosella altamirensis TaxID=616997 RepID=A0A839RPM6_9ACTN|nr:hypothetical protein [Hoyosella altamirensis]MBB3038158.1 hypothetical protein [Hoyosella altamirensis]
MRESDGGLLLLTLHLRDQLGFNTQISEPVIPRLHPPVDTQLAEVDPDAAGRFFSYWIQRAIIEIGKGFPIERYEAVYWHDQLSQLGIPVDALRSAQTWRECRGNEARSVTSRGPAAAGGPTNLTAVIEKLLQARRLSSFHITLITLPLEEDWQYRSGQALFLSPSLRNSDTRMEQLLESFPSL